MIVDINGRKVLVSPERAERVKAKINGQTRKNREISRQLKSAGILPRSAGNTIAFQTATCNPESQTEETIATITAPAKIENSSEGLTHTVKSNRRRRYSR